MSVKPTKLEISNSSLPYGVLPSDGTDLFNEVLPNEIVQEIFDNLGYSQLRTCNLVCKNWHVLANDEAYLKTREPEMAFGQKKWEAHFGNVGKVPPLPDHIHQLLESPCPIWEGKKIKDTHVLVYIPEQVDGQPHTVNNIGKIVALKTGISYRDCTNGIAHQHCDTPCEKGEWVLMTNDVIPGSRRKSPAELQTLVEELSAKAKAKYEVPRLIEVVTCVFAAYASSGTRLYSDDPWSYTLCQETSWNLQLIAGGFMSSGLLIYIHSSNNLLNGVGAVRKL